MNGWISDLGFAVRTMARKPQANLMLIATLVLGISITTAVFSVLAAVLLRPFPFVDPNRVVVLGGAGFNDFDYWNGNHTFEHIGSYFSGGANLVADGVASRTQVAEVSSDFFAVFSARPLAGNVFEDSDRLSGRNHIAVLSHGFWQRNFNSNLSALGTTLRINGEDYVITGIMPAGFSIPGDTALWVPNPRGSAALDLASGEQIDLPNHMARRIVGRLREGVTLDQARREMEDLRLALAKKLAGTRNAVTSHVNVGPYQQRLISEFRPGLMLVFLASTIVLVIACVNAGGLLFARGAMRRKEIAVRMSLGASRWLIARQLLAEGAVIAAVSGVAAIALSAVLIRGFRIFGLAEIPLLSGVNLNLRALIFALVISQLTGFLAGLWPALRCSSVRILPSLQSSGPGSGSQFSTRSRRLLILAEVAAAMALTCTAGVAMRSLRNLMSVDVGFAREHVLTMRLAPPMPHPARSANATPADAAAAQKASFANVMATRQRMLDTVRSIPGVNFGAETDKLPLDRTPNGYTFLDIGTNLDAAMLHTNEINGDYFAALGIPQLVGRTFDALDDASSPKICVVNIRLASYFGGVTESLGKQVKPEGWDAPRQIVGVVANSLTSSLDSEVDPELYVPVSQNISGRPSTEVALILRVAGDPQQISAEVTRRLRQAFSDAPPFQVETLDQVISDSVAQPRFRGELLAGFAALGMALALAGIYGVIAFTVAARTHEIGIRLALGAERSRILRMVLAEGLKLGVAGIIVGVGVAWSLKRYLATLVFGVKALDPATIVAAAVMLIAVALLACAVPALRASRVDPVTALHYE